MHHHVDVLTCFVESLVSEFFCFSKFPNFSPVGGVQTYSAPFSA